MSTIKMLKPLENFSGLSDADLVSRGTVVQTNMTGNSHFVNPPVDLAALKTALDTLTALIAQALEGTKKVIAQKHKQREVVIKMLRLLARYVEVTSNGDMAIFQTSGFQPASTTKTAPAPLTETIRKIAHGPNSGQVKIWVRALRGAASHEVRYAPVVNNATPTGWSTQGVSTIKTPVVITGLTPATIYAFQARALVKNTFTDWSDSVTFIVT
jgi:hypothetical protein